MICLTTNAQGSNKTIIAESKFVVNSENTLYLLKTDIDLKGTILNVPKNCEIRCDGGNIKNGTIHGDETILSGKQPNFIDCKLTGSFKSANIEYFKHKRNQDLARIRNLTINSDCEIEVEETDSLSLLQTITGNDHVLTLKWVKPLNGEHAVFNIVGKFSLSDLKIKVKNVLVDKQTHRPAIFMTKRNGYDIQFSNVKYYGSILFHKMHFDVNHFFKEPSYINFDNVHLETDNITEEYFLIEYIDRSNFYKPEPYKGEMKFRNCFFITNSDNAYAPISIQMPYKLRYEDCTFQRNSQKKVCSLETVVPDVSFTNCVMTNVGFVDNNSYSNLVKSKNIHIDRCKISQTVVSTNLNTRMRALYYSNIDIEDSHFIINGSQFSLDAFDYLKIKNCRFDITQDCSFNQGFVIYRSYPNDSTKTKCPHIIIDNLEFNYLGSNNKNSMSCLLEFEEKIDGSDLRKHLKIKDLKVKGFGGKQFVQFIKKDKTERLFWNENIKKLEYRKNCWKQN